MKGRLLQNLSVNAVQLVANQVLGLGIFYILSTGLDKHSFGEINLALAILLAAFNILSCGIDQLVVKKIAAGDDIRSTLSLYIWHVIFTGLVFYGIVLGAYLFAPASDLLYWLLALIGAGKLLIFFSTPFKQAANGMERFKMLAYMLVISNLVRCTGLILLSVFGGLTLHNIVVLFIAGDAAELLFCILIFVFSAKIAPAIQWDRVKYFRLLREALPQTGVVLLTSALARFDWIFIGLLVSAEKLAEYSFAYKLFEISSLPLLAIAPLLIPRFTKLFGQNAVPVQQLKFLVRVEMIIAAFTVLILNICWSPVIDGITAGKYGLVNVKTIFILSLCLPFIYLNNYFWTIYFAQGHLKMILRSFVITFTVNVAGDILLIPFFKNEGAAFAFLAASVVQFLYYIKQNKLVQLNTAWQPLVISTMCAIACGVIAKLLFQNGWLTLVASVVLYGVSLIATRQIRRDDLPAFKSLLIKN
jgi:O-antigen/teichoic acid export membrane protein